MTCTLLIICMYCFLLQKMFVVFLYLCRKWNMSKSGFDVTMLVCNQVSKFVTPFKSLVLSVTFENHMLLI